MSRDRLFYVMYPGSANPLGPVCARDEAAARAWARSFQGGKRLPVGTQIWETSQRELDAMVTNTARANVVAPWPD